MGWRAARRQSAGAFSVKHALELNNTSRLENTLHRCAPGRAGCLQNSSTGFDSLRRCLSVNQPIIADVARCRKAPAS